MPAPSKPTTALVAFLALTALGSASPALAESKEPQPSQDEMDEGDPGMREKALRAGAFGFGAQVAGYRESLRVNAWLDSHSQWIDRVFNFRPLMLKAGDYWIRPPVIVEHGGAAKLDRGGQVLRYANRAWRVDSQARFTIKPPHWRGYLIQHAEKPEKPATGLAPRNREETRLWQEWYEKGREAGKEQARLDFQYSLSELARDHVGMTRYHLLRDRNIVSQPVVDQRSRNTTGGGGEMTLDDRVLQIEVKPGLNPDTGEWKSIPELPDTEWLEEGP